MEKLQAMESLHAAFRQQISGELHTGRLWVSKPNHFRIETNSPWQQILISDGATFWNYDIDLEQLTIADLLAESMRRVSNEESISALFQ